MQDENNQHRYDDIIHLPHHQSQTRSHMSNYDRAAQFAPFAALTGHDENVREAARLTDNRPELSDERKSELSAKLTWMRDNIDDQSEVEITYFVPDKKKDGGAYFVEKGVLKRIDEYNREIVMMNGNKIWMDDIVEIFLHKPSHMIMYELETNQKVR